MSSHAGLVTADELCAIPDDGFRYELVAGEVRKTPSAASEHGRIAGRITQRLGDHVERIALGATFAAGTGFRIVRDPDTVRAPDAAFVSHRRLETIDDTCRYLPLAPDLVVEVVSPSDTFSEVESKAASWLEAGTNTVIVADPKTRTLRIYRHSDAIQVLHPGDVFDAGDVVEGWMLEVNDALAL